MFCSLACEQKLYICIGSSALNAAPSVNRDRKNGNADAIGNYPCRGERLHDNERWAHGVQQVWKTRSTTLTRA